MNYNFLFIYVGNRREMRRRLFLLAVLIIQFLAATGQDELTIFVIPSKVKYDWSSPCTLMKSYIRNVKRNLIGKNSYLLGHAFLQLKTKDNPDAIITGMRASSHKEPRDMVFKEHYGLAILGADMTGELESKKELREKIDHLSKKGRLAFMTIRISEEAAGRMTEFFNAYKSGTEKEGSPGARYGGAFWPRYRNEGAGCSAFVVSFLDVAGLLEEQFDRWLVKIDIPMDLIGGPYNNGNHVHTKDIKKYDHWAGRNSSEKEPYEHFEIYDPTLMFEWIQELFDHPEKENSFSYSSLKLNKANGIYIDGTNTRVDESEPIFLERKSPSIFIDYFNKKYSFDNQQ